MVSRRERVMWWCFALLLLALIGIAEAEESGRPGPQPKTLPGFWHHRFQIADTAGISVVTDPFPAGVPSDSAYVDTLFVARDLDGDGEVDSVGVSDDYLPMVRLDLDCVTQGPDTLWLKALDDEGAVVQAWSVVTGTAGSGKGLYQYSYSIAAPRVVYAVGSAGYGDRWQIAAYFQRR